MAAVKLPGRPAELVLRDPPQWPSKRPAARSRRAFAAAHVAARTGADGIAIDWDATLRFRHQLWDLGLGVAEAMDTAQRGMGLTWSDTRQLIRRSAAEAQGRGARIACGVGTDQLVAGSARSVADVVAAFEQQLAVVEDAGAQVVLMASRELARVATTAEDYTLAYGPLLRQTKEPVILHWLGEMFDPALAGYWGGANVGEAARTVVAIIAEHADRIDGIKVSLLDQDREIALRRALPKGVRLYTGDDFNYPELIRGDEHGYYSDALLGVFAAIAVPAAAALAALDDDDRAAYDAILAPTVPLARHVFAAPTYFYKTGIAFLAWLNGHQDEFVMLADLHHKRDTEHLVRLFELADAAGVLTDPDRAVARMQQHLDRIGVPS